MSDDASYEPFWEAIGCHTHSAREVLSMLLCIFIGLLMAFMIHILYTLLKHKPPEYKTTILFFAVDFIFYIANIVLILNHCYILSGSLQWVGFIIQASGYTLSFQIFIGLLFKRLYIVFKNTSYEISKVNVYCFAFVQIFGISGLLLLILNDGLGIDSKLLSRIALFGTILMIIIAIPWVSGLYIYKLYRVAYAHACEHSNNNAGLLKQIIKNTILTVTAVLGTILTLIVLFFLVGLPDRQVFLVDRMTKLCLSIDVGTNMLTFILGFRYFATLYERLCGCCHIKSGAIFMRLAQHSVRKRRSLVSVTSTVDRPSAAKSQAIELTTTPSTVVSESSN